MFWAKNLVGAIFSAFCNYAGTLAKEKVVIPQLGPVIATDIEGDFTIDQTSFIFIT